MTLYGAIFYLLAAIILAATALALTRRALMHAVVYLVNAFFATAMLFYLLGAPLPAAFEVIIYAGAIMVLFLFIIMLMGVKDGRDMDAKKALAVWLPPVFLGAATLAAGWVLITAPAGAKEALPMARATPAELGRFVFDRYWLGVEAVSFLLFAGLAGALFLGKSGDEAGKTAKDGQGGAA